MRLRGRGQVPEPISLMDLLCTRIIPSITWHFCPPPPLQMSHGQLREPEAAEQGRPGEALRRRLSPALRLVVHAEAVVVIQGCNSIDLLNFGHKTGCKTGPSSGATSVLGHYKLRHVSKLQTCLGHGSGPDSGTKNMSIELYPRPSSSSRERKEMTPMSK